MRVAAIGDIHGESKWEELLGGYDNGTVADIDKYDKIVFLGDYVDSHERSDAEIRKNLENIIELKKNNRDKIELLWGNHDVQYIFGSIAQCSGRRYSMQDWIKRMFTDNYELFSLSYQVNNHLFTHAGVHKGWYNLRFKKYHNQGQDISFALNEAFDHNYRCQKESEMIQCIHDVGYMRGGRHDVGGPLWVDIHMLDKLLPSHHQIVGHNRVGSVNTKSYGLEQSITFCDCLHAEASIYVTII